MREFVCDHKVFIFVFGGIVEVGPRRAYGFVCVILAGTSEGLADPRVLEGARCRCCGTK